MFYDFNDSNNDDESQRRQRRDEDDRYLLSIVTNDGLNNVSRHQSTTNVTANRVDEVEQRRPFDDYDTFNRYDPKLFVTTGPGTTRLNKSVALLPRDSVVFDSHIRSDTSMQSRYDENALVRASLHPFLSGRSVESMPFDVDPGESYDFELRTYFVPIFDLSEKLLNNYRQSSFQNSVLGSGGSPAAARERKDLVSQLRSVVSHILLILQDYRRLKLLNETIVRVNNQIRESKLYVKRYIELSNQTKMDVDGGDPYFHQRYTLDRLEQAVRDFRAKNNITDDEVLADDEDHDDNDDVVGSSDNDNNEFDNDNDDNDKDDNEDDDDDMESDVVREIVPSTSTQNPAPIMRRSRRSLEEIARERRDLRKIRDRLAKLRETRNGLSRRIDARLQHYKNTHAAQLADRRLVISSLNSFLNDVFLAQSKDHPELVDPAFTQKFSTLIGVLRPLYDSFRQFLINRDILDRLQNITSSASSP